MGLLDLGDVRELEDMVIICIYNNMLGCRLDNKQQQMVVEFVASRDFRVEDAPKLFEQLNKWLAHVESVEKMLESNLRGVTKRLEESAKNKIKVQEKSDAMRAEAIVDVESQKKTHKPGGNALFNMLSGGFGLMHGMEHGQGKGHGNY